MNASASTLGWRNLWRDLRAGELRLLMVAVTLAVAALTAVGFFSDRLQGGLQRDARQLLGGDAVVVSDHAPATVWAEQARALGLQSALTLSFPTMGRAGDAQGGATRLVALKAVEPGYPLRGGPGGRSVEYTRGQCPQTERGLKELVTLFIHEQMTEEDILDMAKAIHKVALGLARK